MSVAMTEISAYTPFSVPENTGQIDPSAGSRRFVDDEAQSGRAVERQEDKETSFDDKLELSREAEEIRELQARDREVRAHEMAHAAVGGSYAGPPTYTYERGPDGRNYAVGGSVNIDVSPVPGDPQATLQKAQQVRAAALAPVQPSAKDMQVAQQAQMMAAEARNEIRQEQMEERKEIFESEEDAQPTVSVAQGISAYTRGVVDSGPARLEMYS